MGDGYWSQSHCKPEVWWKGQPNVGADYWTQRFGQYWLSGTVHAWYAWWNYECSSLGPPVKHYGYISEFGGGEGVWFQGGCIIYRYATGGWTTYWGDYGQTAGRLMAEPLDESRFVEGTEVPPGNWPSPMEAPMPQRRGRKPRPPRIRALLPTALLPAPQTARRTSESRGGTRSGRGGHQPPPAPPSGTD